MVLRNGLVTLARKRIQQERRAHGAPLLLRSRLADRLQLVQFLLGKLQGLALPREGHSPLKHNRVKMYRYLENAHLVMSELKRDNGILAFYYDMFQLAKSNLEYALAQRSNDPGAHYYYAKVLKLVGRTDEDKKTAENEFLKAAQTDTRSRFYGAHL